MTDLWSRLPTVVLTALSEAWGIEVADVPAFLVGSYGTRPSLRFVQDNWLTLRERWLSRDENALNRVADELRVFGVGKHLAQMPDIDYLRTCSNARRLRDIVLTEILTDSQSRLDPTPSRAPAAAEQAADDPGGSDVRSEEGEELGHHEEPPSADEDIPPPVQDTELKLTGQVQGWREIAAWAIRERSLEDAAPLWSLNSALDPPAEVTATWEDFLQISLDDVADKTLLDTVVDDLIADVIGSFVGSRSVVLQQRILTPTPVVLEACGQQLGVTRERVRQIQRSTAEELDCLLQDRRLLPLRWRAADLAAALGGAAPAHHPLTTAALERATRDVGPEHVEIAAALMLRLAGPYRLRDDWYERPGTQLPKAADLEVLTDASGLIPLTDVAGWLENQSIRPDFLDDVVARSGRFHRLGDIVARWSTVVDKCVALLALRGSPADAETLITEMGETYNVTATRDRLFNDPRVIRVNRFDWALRSWELEEYTGIAEEIAQRVRDWGGRARLSDLVDELVRQFRVSPVSVRAYAEAPMFVLEDGYVRLRGEGDVHKLDVDVAGCRGLFLDGPERVSFRVAVDPELLRGSGRVCPESLAACLGIVPDSFRLFSHGSGALKVSWPKTAALGPSLGSLRALAVEAGAVDGDLLRLTFAVVDETCTAARVVRSALSNMPLPEAVEALTGLQQHTGDLRLRLAQAMGVDVGALVPTLQRRGESALLDLLPAEEPDDALKEALSGLADLLDSR